MWCGMVVSHSLYSSVYEELGVSSLMTEPTLRSSDSRGRESRSDPSANRREKS